MSSPAAEQLLTAEEFARLPEPEGGCCTELVDGRVVMAPPPGGGHGKSSYRFARELGKFVEAHALGEIMVESGYRLKRRPDTVRGPDVSFIANDRLPVAGLPAGYLEGAPTLAVEVLSPNDAQAAVLTKVGEYLDAGAERVWLVRSANKSVTVYFAGGDVATLHSGDTLNSAHAGFTLEGFALPIDEIFA